MAERLIHTYKIGLNSPESVQRVVMDQLFEEVISMYVRYWREKNFRSCEVLMNASYSVPYVYHGTKYKHALLKDLLLEQRERIK